MVHRSTRRGAVSTEQLLLILASLMAPVVAFTSLGVELDDLLVGAASNDGADTDDSAVSPADGPANLGGAPAAIRYEVPTPSFEATENGPVALTDGMGGDESQGSSTSDEESSCSGWTCRFRSAADWAGDRVSGAADWAGDRVSDLNDIRNDVQDLSVDGLQAVHGWADDGMSWVDEQLADSWVGSIPLPHGRNLGQTFRMAHGAVNATFELAEGLLQIGNFLIDLQVGDPDAHRALQNFVTTVVDDPSILGDIGHAIVSDLWGNVHDCATGDDYSCGELAPDVILTVATGGAGKAASIPSRIAHLPARLRSLFTRGGARAAVESGAGLVDNVVARDTLLASSDDLSSMGGAARHAPGFTPDGTARPLADPDFLPDRHSPGFLPDPPEAPRDPDFVSPNRHAPGFTADGTPRALDDPDFVSPNRHAPGFTADGTPRPLTDPDFVSPNQHAPGFSVGPPGPPRDPDFVSPNRHAPGFTADGQPRPWQDPDYVSPNQHAPGFTADGQPRPHSNPPEQTVTQTFIVNPTGRLGTDGRELNCAQCAVATDATLGGAPATAMRSYDVMPVERLEDIFGKPFGPARSDPGLVAREMHEAGDGARGIVFGSRGADEPGHFFNVVNRDGQIIFVDGQTGTFASVMEFSSWRLLRTN